MVEQRAIVIATRIPFGALVAVLYRVAIVEDYAPGRFRMVRVEPAHMPYADAMIRAGALNKKGQPHGKQARSRTRFLQRP